MSSLYRIKYSNKFTDRGVILLGSSSCIPSLICILLLDYRLPQSFKAIVGTNQWKRSSYINE